MDVSAIQQAQQVCAPTKQDQLCGRAFQPREPNLSRHCNQYAASVAGHSNNQSEGRAPPRSHTFAKKCELRLA